VTRLPGPVEALAVYSGGAAVERLVPRLRAWYERNRAAHRLRILTPEAVGRWAEDLSFLLEAFPRAVLEVHVSAACAAETERLASPRIDVKTVPAGAWRRHFLRAALERPDPLIALAGGSRTTAALIRVACFASRPLVATAMDHLVRALGVVRGGVASEPGAAR
jgi:hypothetical protein